MKENFCFGEKMFLSMSVVLRAISCVVCNRFVNVGFQYGVTSCTLSKCDIKDAMWQSFSNDPFVIVFTF